MPPKKIRKLIDGQSRLTFGGQPSGLATQPDKSASTAVESSQAQQGGIEGGEMEKYDFTAAVKLWSMKNRHIFHED